MKPNTPLPAVLISYPIPRRQRDPDQRSRSTVLNTILSHRARARGCTSRLVYRDQLAQEVRRRPTSDVKQGPGNLAVIADHGERQGRRDRRGGTPDREIARMRDQPWPAPAELAKREATRCVTAELLEERETAEGKSPHDRAGDDHRRRPARRRPAARRDRAASPPPTCSGSRGKYLAGRSFRDDPLSPGRKCQARYRKGRHDRGRVERAVAQQLVIPARRRDRHARASASRARSSRPRPPLRSDHRRCHRPGRVEFALSNGMRLIVVVEKPRPAAADRQPARRARGRRERSRAVARGVNSRDRRRSR